MGTLRKYWRRWVSEPVMNQLKNGGSPERLAWAVAVGCTVGIFPVMGTTTVLCLLAGWALKLNHIVLQVFQHLVYPLHLALILVFIRLGERLHGVPEIPFAIPELVRRFHHDPLQFAADFGMAAWHGVVAWLLIAPVILLGIKALATPALRSLASQPVVGKETHS